MNQNCIPGCACLNCSAERVIDALGRDCLGSLLEACALNYRRLRATRDSAAIAASNKNSQALIDHLLPVILDRRTEEWPVAAEPVHEESPL